MKNHIFISHSTKDDTFVNNLRKSLESQGLNAWVDSRRLTAGDELETDEFPVWHLFCDQLTTGRRSQHAGFQAGFGRSHQ